MELDGLKWDPKKGCHYLVPEGIRWRCGIFLKADEAKKAAMTEDMGIGFGCGSSLFNEDRERILRLMSRSGSSSLSLDTSSETSAVPTPSTSR